MNSVIRLLVSSSPSVFCLNHPCILDHWAVEYCFAEQIGLVPRGDVWRWVVDRPRDWASRPYALWSPSGLPLWPSYWTKGQAKWQLAKLVGVSPFSPPIALLPAPFNELLEQREDKSALSESPSALGDP
uniref:Uncharacterized protein n=1 Tax=Solanum tuberosum TaxID=4113 RepID=M1DPE0_SOLTU